MPLPQEIDSILDPILKTFRASLLYRLNSHAIMAYISGSAQMTKWAGLPFEGPPMKQAIDYAGKHCAKLVTEMDETTKSRLRDIISRSIEEKRGVEGLARDIRKEFEDMSRYRSKSIAQTETSDALEEAFMTRGRDLGIDGKEWVTAGDESVCDICGGNEEDGVIPFEAAFSSGHIRPPGHPGNCRCACAPARLGRRADR